jgi:hypothetical protein
VLQDTLMNVLQFLPLDHTQRLSATILPLCLVASRKVEGADQQQPPGSSQPLEAIVPHDAVVSSALIRMQGVLGSLNGPNRERLSPVEEELVYASAVQAACVALNHYSTTPNHLIPSL